MVVQSTASPAPDGVECIQVAVLGAGHIGRAMLRGLRSAAVAGAVRLAAATRHPDDLGPGVESYAVQSDPSADRRLACQADVIIVASRPDQTMALIAEIAHHCRPGSILVPTAIGVSIDMIERAVPGEVAVARAMPNTPVEVSLGLSV